MQDQNQAAQIDALQSRYDSFLSRVNLSDISSSLADLRTKVNLLPNAIQQVRSRGYAFRSYLEGKATVLAQQWNESQNQVTLFLQQEAADLRRELDQAGRLISSLRAQPMSAPQQIPNVENIFQRLETKVSAAES